MGERVLVPWLETHWRHLATKPVLAGAAFGLLHLVQVTGWYAGALALLVPTVVSVVRDAELWPGCWKVASFWKDPCVDTWAGGVLVVPLAMTTMPLGYRAALGVAMALVLWPVGLHRWARP